MALSQEDLKRIQAMRVGGKKLLVIKKALIDYTKPGLTFAQIEKQAQLLISQAKTKPSFSTVPGYSWATCITKNDGLCHGIPDQSVVNSGDVITIDVGLIQDGFHLDTSITFPVGPVSPQAIEFLSIGKKALSKAISRAQVGNSVYDVSRMMQKTVEERGYGAVYQLTGHGVGKELHMDPSIPCVAVKSDKRVLFKEGQTVAIEIMYTLGDPYLVLSSDGWTYQTQDGSLSGMFEETVLITANGPEILT